MKKNIRTYPDKYTNILSSPKWIHRHLHDFNIYSCTVSIYVKQFHDIFEIYMYGVPIYVVIISIVVFPMLHKVLHVQFGLLETYEFYNLLFQI